ncbi:Chemotaxis response regulator protein-glutamate methylesterase [Paraliobacillus sp. PM-2]|uniref:protein-glutamate methylesterase/protein-glutamine glutaminase n=1 Tax=Paraliobacillus sp. PM-2 TaxID=1462524 RepID=UPI00061BC321|nr:chemotaxis response regulator protein-glutamate methylesterase [Paraliobacillus sp. PM-2]CQR47679.1 Chemotaxis response regulator protein-glutamate methylesterase [Paraliobacillus sp. PM-2]
MNKINVLVVDDSAFMRKIITDLLNSHPRIHVVDTARNGKDALKKIDELNPDVVTLDVEMPIMDGIAALKRIMAEKPRPVIMLSSLTKEGAEKTLESIALGAVDFIAKPSGSISLDIREKEVEIKSKVLQSVNANVARLCENDKKPEKTVVSTFTQHAISSIKKTNQIVGIGTSTGGPRALQRVVTQLPRDFPAPIVIVQHMPAGFTHSLAKRLDHMSQITVKEAEDNEVLKNGIAYIAPGGYQMQVEHSGRGVISRVTQGNPRNGHQPSVDVLFESLATLSSYQVYTVLMTGMGADGANGLILLKNKKSNTVAISESKETCVVYGMPRAAEKTKLIDFVVELPEISNVLIKQMKARGVNNGNQ